MNNLKDFANDTVIKDLALECKQYRELIPRLYDDLAAVKKAHKDAVEFNYDLAEENTTVHTKVLAMQERIAELEAENARMREAASTTKQQQRIDEARFGMALLATMDLRQVERATKKYIEYRDEGWIPEGLGVSAGYLGASNGN